MIVLLAFALLVGIYNFRDYFGTSSAAPPVSATSTTAQKKGAQAVDSTLDPRLHLNALNASQSVKYEAGGRNIFRMEEPKIETAVSSPRAPYTVDAPPTPTPVPPPPPI